MTARRPALSVVRAGNPGKRPIPTSTSVPPADFAEPDWLVEFPAGRIPTEPRCPARDDYEDASEFGEATDRYERAHDVWEIRKLAIEGSKFARGRASEEWRRVEPVLSKSVGLGAVDFTTLVEYCVCVARLEWCERQLSVQGLVVMGQRGACRNPLTTVATQYRTQLKTYIRELGLSPLARTGVRMKPDDDGDDDILD